MVTIYTDGAAKGNPGPGGYGVVLKFKDKRKEISQGYLNTTNNRMELMAIIAGLKALKKAPLDITIYSDSKYVVDAINKGWIWKWEKTGFKKKKNVDLWQAFLPLYRQHRITFKWVKGHAGNPENERCDELAVAAAENDHKIPDQGYHGE